MLTGGGENSAHALGQFGFHDVLQANVQGEGHVESVARGDVLVAIGHQLALASVHFGRRPAFNPGEVGVEFQFDAVHSGFSWPSPLT